MVLERTEDRIMKFFRDVFKMKMTAKVCLVSLVFLFLLGTGVLLSTGNAATNLNNNLQLSADHEGGPTYTYGSEFYEDEFWKEWYVWVYLEPFVYVDYSVILSFNDSFMSTLPLLSYISEYAYIGNDTYAYLGDSFLVFEIYNDTNGNGIPDAYNDTATGNMVYEVTYILTPINTSDYEIYNIEKELDGDKVIFTWGIRYDKVHAEMLNATELAEWFEMEEEFEEWEGEPEMPNANHEYTGNYSETFYYEMLGAEIDFVGMNYTFIYDLAENKTVLKYDTIVGPMQFARYNYTVSIFINFDEDIFMFNETFDYLEDLDLDLTDLSLSAVHMTDLMIENESLEMELDDTEEIDDPENLPFLYSDVTNLSILVNNTIWGQFEFADNYTLLPDNIQATAYATICRNESIWWAFMYSESYFEYEDVDVPGYANAFGSACMEYYFQSFAYRVSYPLWGNNKTILHDPSIIVYVGEMEAATQGPTGGNGSFTGDITVKDIQEFINSNFLVLGSAAILLLLLSLGVSRKRKLSEYTYSI